MVGEQKVSIFKISGDQGNSWFSAVVGIGRYRGVFNMIFEGSRSFKVNGAVAIDDIEFSSKLVKYTKQ